MPVKRGDAGRQTGCGQGGQRNPADSVRPATHPDWSGDRADERQMNEDEQAGLIDWTEAKQFYEQRDESDSGVEVIEEVPLAPGAAQRDGAGDVR